MVRFLWFSCIFCFIIFEAQSAPIAKKMVDLTYAFDETTPYHPSQKKFVLDVTVNNTVEQGYWVQLEDYSSGIHVGTHMDAPCHFVKGGMTVEQIPLSRLEAPAAVIDITHKAELDIDADITVSDLIKWEEETGHSLDHVILLVRFGWGQRWNNKTAYLGTSGDSNFHFPGLSPDAASWLVEKRNIYALGSESLSLDSGPRTSAGNFQVHRILLPANIYGLENVANMDQLPIYGATLSVLPMKIGSGSGAPVRIIATFPEVLFSDRGRPRSMCGTEI